MTDGGICASEWSHWALVQDHSGFQRHLLWHSFRTSCNSWWVLATSPIFTLPPHSPAHPHPLISHQCCNPSSPSSLRVVQSWVIGPWIAPFPGLSISCLASDLSLLPTTSISKSGQPHPKRSMIHFSTPARINLTWWSNLHREPEEDCGIRRKHSSEYQQHILGRMSVITEKEPVRRPNLRNPIKIMSCWNHHDSYLQDQCRLLPPEPSISSSHLALIKCLSSSFEVLMQFSSLLFVSFQRGNFKFLFLI